MNVRPTIAFDPADRGSIPLSMLVIAALSMVTLALVTTTISSSRAARFDEDFTKAIHAADAGAQAGVAALSRGQDTDALIAQGVPAGCTAETWNACPVYASGNGTLSGTDYVWEARKVDALSWEVRATGTDASGVARTVVQEVSDQARFWLAAFSHQGFEMRGGNHADSYSNSAWYTGNGVVSSNGTVTIHGGSSGVDAVHLYDWDANPDLSRCRHTGGSSCDDVLTLPEAVNPSARIGEPLEIGRGVLETQFIADQLASCPVTPVPDYTTSTYDGGSARLGTAGNDTVYCFDTFAVDQDLTILGNVEVYVYGDLLVSNHTTINCAAGCNVGSSTPDARTLTFYVADSGDAANPSRVAFGNHTSVVGAIFAPHSDCEGNPSNAQASLFGSLICGAINNQGGWSFHYDDRLGLDGAGVYRVGAWREELP